MTRDLVSLSGLVVAGGLAGALALRGSAMDPNAVTQGAHGLGLTPERVVMAVDQVAQGGQMFLRLAGEPELCLARLQAEAQLEDTIAALVVARASLATNPTSASLKAAAAARSAEASAAQASIDQLSAELRGVVQDGLSSASVTRLKRLSSNAARPVPASFGVVDRTPKLWRKVEQALVAEARAARTGSGAPFEVGSLLAATRADSEVVAAEARMSAGLLSVQSAFAAASGPG